MVRYAKILSPKNVETTPKVECASKYVSVPTIANSL